jgi:hypothetical protein
MKDNKLIAEFMGFTYEKNIGWYDNDMNMPQIVYDVQNGNCFNELLFDQSWDWLIPVVEKIERDSFDLFGEYEDTIINGCSCFIYSNSENISTTETSKFKAVYSAVVDYIKEQLNN